MTIFKKSKIELLICSVIGVIIASSCVKADLRTCSKAVGVQFNYNYNTLNSNAFGEEVDKVILYAFDKDGLLVAQESVEGPEVTNDLRIPLPYIIGGKFFFAAIAQSTNIQGSLADFKVPDMIIGESKLTDLNARLKLSADRVQSHELNNFLIGYSPVDISNNSTTQTVTVNMKKVNRKIRIVLLPIRGGAQPLDPTTFDFSIIDPIGNADIDYKYEQLSGEAVIYKPYFQISTAPENGETLSENEINSAIIAEINTARLITSNKPKLIITDKITQKEIVRIDLIWFISLIEMKDNSAKWGLQEYLDREDQYTISLFFENDTGTWLKTTIIINGWVINLADFEL